LELETWLVKSNRCLCEGD